MFSLKLQLVLFALLFLSVGTDAQGVEPGPTPGPAPESEYGLQLLKCTPFIVSFGGRDIECFGHEFHTDMDLQINDVDIEITVEAHVIDEATQEMKFGFTTPRYDTVAEGTEGGWVSMTLVIVPTGEQIDIERVILYVSMAASDRQCTAEGSWWDGSDCRDCPNGAHCPGGDVLWPAEGYWSPDEYTVPEKCDFVEACPGYLMDCADEIDCEVRTDNCATELGFTGIRCSECLQGFFNDRGLCRRCGQTESERIKMIILTTVVCGVVLVMALLVAFLKDKWLANFVSAFIAYQQFILGVTQLSTQYSDAVSEVFTFLDFVNFQVEFVKPGCSVSAISFLETFWLTLLAVAIAAVLFIIAAGIRHIYVAKKQDVRSRGPSMTDQDRKAVNKGFKWRAIHGLLILAIFAYLQITLRCFQAVYCEDVFGTKRLVVQNSIVCYKGAHTYVAAVAWALMFTYSVGFPCLCIFIVVRSNMKGLRQNMRWAKYGSLWRTLKERYYWFRLTTFLINFIFALQAVLAQDVVVRAFVMAVIFLINFVAVGVLQPFDKWYLNGFYLVSGAALAVSTISVMSEVAGQSAAFYILIALICVFVLIVSAYRAWVWKKHGTTQKTIEMTIR